MSAHDRYLAACHAMQSGVAMKMNYDPTDCGAKHLRVGVNAAMVDSGAIIELLVKKGVITEAEWWETVAPAMKREADKYETELSELLGHRVRLA